MLITVLVELLVFVSVLVVSCAATMPCCWSVCMGFGSKEKSGDEEKDPPNA